MTIPASSPAPTVGSPAPATGGAHHHHRGGLGSALSSAANAAAAATGPFGLALQALGVTGG